MWLGKKISECETLEICTLKFLPCMTQIMLEFSKSSWFFYEKNTATNSFFLLFSYTFLYMIMNVQCYI